MSLSRRTALTSLASLSLAAARKAPSAKLQRRIEEEFAESGAASLTMAVAQDGKTIWEHSWGWADKEAKIPATPETVYSLASVTKPLTSTGLMILAERGKLRLDAPLDDYLGGPKLRAFSFQAKEATVRRVATHTAGLPLHAQCFYADEPKRLPAIEESIRRYGILVRPPGERFEYSNFGYALLSRVISHVSGQGYEEFMRREVFEPLGMETTCFPVRFEPGQSVRYSPAGTRLPFFDLDTRGGSCAYASVRDLVRFSSLHLNTLGANQKRILTARSIDELARPTANSPFSAGWRSEDRKGIRLLMFGGGMDGVSTWIMLIPAKRAAIVALCNKRMDLPGPMSSAVLREMFPDIRSIIEPPVSPERRFEPVRNRFRGEWRGAVFTHQQELPFCIRLKSELLGGTVQLANREEIHVPNLCSVDGRLCGSFPEDIGTDDVRRPHRLRFELTLRSGNKLDGPITSHSSPAGKIGDSLASFVSLKKTG